MNEFPAKIFPEQFKSSSKEMSPGMEFKIFKTIRTDNTQLKRGLQQQSFNGEYYWNY